MMALVRCPECGKEKVSDSAQSCPVCGYGIKAHYDKRAKKKQDKQIFEMRMNQVAEPQKPKDNIYGIVIGIGGAVLSLFMCTQLMELGLIGFCVMIIIAIIFYNQHVKAMEQYQKDCELYKTDKKAYQRQKVQEEDFRRAVEALEPKCPHCNSTNIERISTIDRAVSVETVGLASGKIGKQYKCKNCKHMW